jgi:hypothetical protein
VLQGILGVQKCFRGLHARHFVHELKEGVMTLQSCNACISLAFKLFHLKHFFACSIILFMLNLFCSFSVSYAIWIFL